MNTNMTNTSLRYGILLVCHILLSFSSYAQQFSRGIGVYPGNPNEYFGPTMEKDTTYRNLALHRAVYQSGAHDLNLTAQLITDGVVADKQPAFLEVLTNGIPLPHNERKLTINDSEWSRIPVQGSEATLTYQWSNMDIQADEIVVNGFVAYNQDVHFQSYSMQCDLLGTKA